MNQNFANYEQQQRRANTQAPRLNYQQQQAKWKQNKKPFTKQYGNRNWSAEPGKTVFKNSMTILAKKGQRGNPVLNKAPFFIKFEDELDKSERGQNGFPYESEEMVEDFLVHKSISILFLSLAYHKTYPQYLNFRLSKLYNRKRDARRILLLKHDCEDPQNVINAIFIECATFNATCLVCWSDLEAQQYIHTFKTYESKGDTLLQGKTDTASISRKLMTEWKGDTQQTHNGMTTEVVSSIRRINKTDAKNLMNNYGSVKNIVECQNYSDFISIDGIGQSKVESLTQCFRGPFDPEKKVYRKKESIGQKKETEAEKKDELVEKKETLEVEQNKDAQEQEQKKDPSSEEKSQENDEQKNDSKSKEQDEQKDV